MRADIALRESSFQLKGWNLIRRLNYLISPEEKSWLRTELDRRERVLHEDRMGSPQEIEELKKLRCAEAEIAK